MKQMTILLLSLACLTASAQIKVKPEDAAKHVGDSISVCGKVYGGIYLEHNIEQPTLINVGAAYPNAPFTAVILQQIRALFTTAPEVYYKDSAVCITGRVALYNGKPQIVVSRTDQITFPGNQTKYETVISLDTNNIFQGQWQGSAYQAYTKTTWDIMLTCDFKDSLFKANYPSLKCSANWELLKVSDRSIKFIEHVTDGKDSCMDKGLILLKAVTRKRLEFYAYHPDDTTYCVAKGMLNKR